MRSITVVLLLLPLLTACGGGDDDKTLTVLAASSLTETFEELATTFEKEHPGVDVRFSFDSSATLADQAAQGAPGDVLATADHDTMQTAVDAGATTAEPVRFAQNQLVLVTPKDNPAGITGFTDLATSKFVACVDTAPCGKVAAALLADNHVTAEPASLEVDVKSVLAKVTEGEADAGLVYRTDQVAAGDDVLGFPIPGAQDERTDYYLAPLEQAGDADLAQEWIDLLTSTEGQRVLAEAGFITS
jgi:molybdate transport system substrate-binding protein